MKHTGSRVFLSLILALSGSTGSAAPIPNPAPKPTEPAKIARPKQYVMVGFDGGLNVEQWAKLRNFADTMKKEKKPLNFTYFVSGVYFLSDNNKHIYAPPKHTVGYSMIGFAEDKGKFISNRVDQMNLTIHAGQEIASHANGHFDAEADKWNADDWSSELKQYDSLLFGAFFNNKILPNPTNKYPHGYAFDSKEVVGFRAPYLGVTPELFPALKAFGYTYDVSTTGEPTDWPKKDENGIWRFAVPVIHMAGTGKKIINMDYNFYVAQSKAVEDPPNREAYRKQMVDTYMNYFYDNYYGHRAPVYIGHHFSLYNGGAYWDALQDFTKAVCGLPEVKCINYKQYAGWVESLKGEALKSYRAGKFDILPRPKVLTYQPEPALDVKLEIAKNGEDLQVLASGADYSKEDMNLVVKVNNKSVPADSLALSELRRRFSAGTELKISAALFNKNGQEIQSATHLVKDLGTTREQFVSTPLESRLLLGDLPEAHEWQ